MSVATPESGVSSSGSSSQSSVIPEEDMSEEGVSKEGVSAVISEEGSSSKAEARLLLGCHPRIHVHMFGSAKNMLQIPLVNEGDKEMTIEDLKEALFLIIQKQSDAGVFEFWKGGGVDELLAVREVKEVRTRARRSKSWQGSAKDVSKGFQSSAPAGLLKRESGSDEGDVLANGTWDGSVSDPQALSKMLEQGPKFYMLRAFPADSKAVVDSKLFDNWLCDEEKTIDEYYAMDRMAPAKNIVTKQLKPGCCFHLGLEPAFKMPQRQWFCKISQTRQVPDLNNKIYTQYVVEIKHGRLHWQVSKRYREFHKLNETLRNRKLASTLSLLKVRPCSPTLALPHLLSHTCSPTLALPHASSPSSRLLLSPLLRINSLRTITDQGRHA
jgi:hypothetical protein